MPNQAPAPVPRGPRAARQIPQLNAFAAAEDPGRLLTAAVDWARSELHGIPDPRDRMAWVLTITHLLDEMLTMMGRGDKPAGWFYTPGAAAFNPAGWTPITPEGDR